MRETNHPDARSAASQTATLQRIDASEMWENLCRTDELLDDCEALAAARAEWGKDFV